MLFPRACAMADDVQSLTAAIASGDTEAFARFYRAWFDPMFLDARAFTRRDESFCLDIVHDAMLRIIRSRLPRRMESGDDLRRWLRTVVRRCAIDRARQETRRRRREEAASTMWPAARDTAAPEQRPWLQARLAAMDAGSAGLLYLRYQAGLSLERIGAVLGMKAGAVDGRLRRIVQALRRSAAEEFHGHPD
jgi:RNA polymerase sigma factor (sigma-70 family)